MKISWCTSLMVDHPECCWMEGIWDFWLLGSTSLCCARHGIEELIRRSFRNEQLTEENAQSYNVEESQDAINLVTMDQRRDDQGRFKAIHMYYCLLGFLIHHPNSNYGLTTFLESVNRQGIYWELYQCFTRTLAHYRG